MKWRYILLLVIMLSLGAGMRSVAAIDCSDGNINNLDIGQLEICKNESQKELDMSLAATAPLETEVKKLGARIATLQKGINTALAKLKTTETGIKERSEKVSTQYLVLSVKIREMYIRLRSQPLWVSLLSNTGMGQARLELSLRQESSDRDKQIIVNLVQEIGSLEADKKKLEIQKAQLAKLQAELDKQSDFFEGEVAKAKAYQKDLTGKIAALSAKQQAIISARSGSYITGVGSVPISGDYDATIAGFKEKAPSGSFAVFSFGAHTHRNGMSQYGAKKRAEDGQDYKKILNAYYKKEPVQKDTGGDIKVIGYDSMNFEEKYLYGIAEMPDSWHKEALKAQAVAARTFAYRNYKTQNKAICTDEHCQAFSKNKADNPPQAWREAVQETRGMILEDISTQYSAIAGGYLNTSGWDTADGSGGDIWTSKAWESKANAPWFYKAWYREVKSSGTNRYSDSNSDCGRKPWMSTEEMSDIINAWVVLKRGEGNGVDTGRVLPVTINQCSVGGQTGDPYSVSDLRSKLSNPVTSISSVTTRNNNNGQTTEVVFQTNRGELSISGSEFKQVFNTRAPGYLAIHQGSFTFINIEKK